MTIKTIINIYKISHIQKENIQVPLLKKKETDKEY